MSYSVSSAPEEKGVAYVCLILFYLNPCVASLEDNFELTNHEATSKPREYRCELTSYEDPNKPRHLSWQVYMTQFGVQQVRAVSPEQVQKCGNWLKITVSISLIYGSFCKVRTHHENELPCLNAVSSTLDLSVYGPMGRLKDPAIHFDTTKLGQGHPSVECPSPKLMCCSSNFMAHCWIDMQYRIMVSFNKMLQFCAKHLRLASNSSVSPDGPWCITTLSCFRFKTCQASSETRKSIAYWVQYCR